MNSDIPRTTNSSNSTKLIMLGIAALLLAISIFFSAFAAIPLAIGVITFGRKGGYLTAAFFGVMSIIVSIASTNGVVLSVFYGLGLLLAVYCSEIVLRNINPIKAIIMGGVSLFILMYVYLLVHVQSTGTSIKELVVNYIGEYAEVFKEKMINSTQGINAEESLNNLAMLEQPEEVADIILRELPGYTLMSNFLLLWIILFIGLKVYRLKNGEDIKRFSDKSLLAYKVPDHFIWFMILGLVFTLWGEELGTWYPLVGGIIVQGIGAFYFFQGFGIYIEFLDFARLHGLLRVILVSITVLTVGSFIAIIGMFDMFFNFRKFLQKKEI